MKLIFVFLISLPTFLFGQNQFRLNTEVGDSLWVEINGEKICLNEEFSEINTNYPNFDTFKFLSESSNYQNEIICNFKPDSSYSIAGACCASLDIIPSSKLKNDSLKIWDYEVDFSKIQNSLMDRPFISMRIASETVDTIFGSYVDYACFPQFKRLEVEKWEYGVPQKCFYWSNISPFVFFKSSVDYSEFIYENGVVEDVYPDFEEIEILGEINVRLFDNERFVLTFDPVSKEVVLEYDE